MAQTTITYLDATGATQTLEATTGASYKIPNNRICDASGHFLPPMDAVGRAGYVFVTDGTNTQPTMDAAARRGYVTVTDGTNTMPTMDAVARRGYITVTDGTNSMPTMDVVARKGFVLITDGTDSCAIEAVNAAVSESTVTSIRTLSALFGYDSGAAAGSKTVPLAVATGTNTVLVQACNSTNLTPAGDAAARPIYHALSDATTGPVAVKAASTAAGATDKALVVSLSPNSPAYSNSDGGGSAGAAGSGATLSKLGGSVFKAWGSLPAATNGQQVGDISDAAGTKKVGVAPLGTPLYNGSGNVANSAATATLTGSATTMVFLDGFDIDGLGATTGVAKDLTITGLLGGTLTIPFGVPAGATVPVRASYRFNPPLQASAVNTAIVVSVAAFGSGNTNACVTAYGHHI